MFQSLLALIPCSLDRPARGLVATADPAGDARFWGVAPYVGVDGCDKGIVCVLEGGCGKDPRQLLGELFLVEVAEEKEGQGFFVDDPVSVTYGALHGCI